MKHRKKRTVKERESARTHAIQSGYCPKCRSTAYTITPQLFRNGTLHLRQDCADCGTHLKYAPQTIENLDRLFTT